jgi:hypothetical protein
MSTWHLRGDLTAFWFYQRSHPSLYALRDEWKLCLTEDAVQRAKKGEWGSYMLEKAEADCFKKEGAFVDEMVAEGSPAPTINLLKVQCSRG